MVEKWTANFRPRAAIRPIPWRTQGDMRTGGLVKDHSMYEQTALTDSLGFSLTATRVWPPLRHTDLCDTPTFATR